MSKRTRIFLGILLAYVLGFGWLLQRQLADIDPRYRESAEESLVETAQLMATWVEQQSRDGQLRTEGLTPVFDALHARRFRADIFGFIKTRVDLRLSVTDANGRVVFDSLGQDLGQDHAQWRDVHLALKDQYGARLTLDKPGDPSTGVMHVAAPVRVDGRIIGTVSAAKPVESFGQFVEAARRKTLQVGLLSVVAVLLFAVIVSMWLVRPVGAIADYFQYVRQQRSFNPRRLARRAWSMVRNAYDEMRDALAGHNHVVDHVQTLTHEVKSPLSAIRGAAELLQEPMPDEDRARFAANIVRETQRIQELVDRMTELTTLESRHSLKDLQAIAIGPLLRDQCAAAQHLGAARGIDIDVQLSPAEDRPEVEGDAFLLQRALANLLSNAVEFSPPQSRVEVRCSRSAGQLHISVRDHGPGIPAYAQDKVFEKFYSLPRPGTGKRSTGLGLAFVKEIAHLHLGSVTLGNAPEGGAIARLTLPLLR